jgi:hypothetical protein
MSEKLSIKDLGGSDIPRLIWLADIRSHNIRLCHIQLHKNPPIYYISLGLSLYLSLSIDSISAFMAIFGAMAFSITTLGVMPLNNFYPIN